MRRIEDTKKPRATPPILRARSPLWLGRVATARERPQVVVTACMELSVLPPVAAARYSSRRAFFTLSSELNSLDHITTWELRVVKTLATTLSCTALLVLSACQIQPSARNTSTATSAKTIAAHTDAIFEKLVAIRRDLHQHPELAGAEVRTSAKIATHLRELGLEVKTNLYGHSVVAILRGAKPGRTIVWRSELDALPGFYPDPEPFRSTTKDVHHACGHDIHIAVALGIAEVLTMHRAALAGTVVFVFQPEEETFTGAKALMEKGVFASTPADEIYGMHITAFPVGDVRVRPAEMFAHQRRVRLTLRDELSSDEIDQLVKLVQTTMFRARPDARPWAIQQLVDPTVGVAAPETAFQDFTFMDSDFSSRREGGELLLEAYLYETSASALPTIIPRIEQAVVASGHRSRLLEVKFVQANPTVLNDPRLTRLAIRALQQSYGTDAVKPLYGQAPFFNDDFAYFQQQTPGVYFFVGGSNFEKGLIAFNHSPNFRADEESIRVAVTRFSSLVLARAAARD